MAREEKRVELKTVEDVPATKAPVIRLESDETLQRPKKPVRLGVQQEEPKVSQRLDLPARDEFESRTHQPGIEALIEPEEVDPNFLEKDWGRQTTHQRQIPWGWFVLLGLVLAGAALWSLSGAGKSDEKTEAAPVDTAALVVSDAKEDEEAAQLIDRIDRVTRQYFQATNVDDLLRSARQPDRVRPLMESYYGGKSVPSNPLVRTLQLQPLTLENRANFWVQAVELADGSTPNLIAEILENGEPKIDWETLVCYQPMKWDTFATERPAGTSFDFRVYVEPDNFFSHEFSDSTIWNCFRLTTLDSEETLFGYSKINDPLSTELLKLLKENRGRMTSMILRVSVPQGIQSRRGVVIEKLMSPRWLYLNPPEA
jgi:hypothetical protein